MRALVVDDSRSMRTIVSRILKSAGVEEILQAGDGQEAIEVMESNGAPDFATVDWHMPNMNGLEFVSAVRKRKEWREMAIMMVTTENEQGQIVRALAAGAHEYLIKPFTAEAMVEKLTLLGFTTTAEAVPSAGGW